MRNPGTLSLLLCLGLAVAAAGHGQSVGLYAQPDPSAYASDRVESYLSPQQLIYIRPGLNIEIESIQIPPNRRPVVTLSFSDDFEQPLDREGKVTPGPISVSFVLAYYDAATRQYAAYTTRDQTSPITGVTETQASSDRGGTWEDLGLGRARYTFATQLPAGFDGSRTHTLALYATRDLRDIIEKRYVANPILDFRPDGGAVTETWNGVSDATCNECHYDLAFHGGSRKAQKLCITCHSSQSVDPDTGNTVDYKVMIHKIHRGANLPSVEAGMPYQIIGFRQSVHDYSTVEMPQDIRNCDTCHRPDSPEGDIWFTRPSRDACGSCHDLVDWVTGEGHAGGPQLDDSLCSACHRPQGEMEFDASIMGAHTIPLQSSQLAGLNVEFTDIQNTMPGQRPTVTIRTYDDFGTPIDPTTLDRFGFILAGPTTDYMRFLRESLGAATVAGDLATYTLETPIPEDAMGTWSLSADVYRNVVIDDGSEDGIQVREAAFNPLIDFPVTDGEPQPRRQVVSNEKCESCHKKLAFHGDQRFAIHECVMCHHAEQDDSARRPEEEFPPASVHFKWLIHRLHTGEELDREFTVFGFGGRPHNYNELRYPGILYVCTQCHEEGTYSLPTPEGALATIAPRDFFSPIPPDSAACLSCHFTDAAASHAFVNIAPFGEACASCHGEEREFSVEKVHAH